MSLGGGGANKEAKRARREEEARQARIRAGTGKINETFGQFDDDFYGGIRNSYLDFAKPQLEDQFEDAGEDLTYNLARRGILHSSMRGDQVSDLQKIYDRENQGLVDQARSVENETRGGIEDARSDLVRMLHATGDADQASAAALSRATALSRPPAFSPLGQLFSDFTGGLAMQAGLERQHSMGGPRPRYHTGLFSPSRSVVVR